MAEEIGPKGDPRDPRDPQHSRQFLDFFWDLASPRQDLRLRATEGLLQYLREGRRSDDLKYALKRLISGLAATRESSRPGFSLALGQVLQCFEEIPLTSVLDQIREQHDLSRVKKKPLRSAAFGNFFGVLALIQSGRLMKDHKALVACVQLLQSLDQHRRHLQDQPRKALVDLLSEVPEAVFESVLLDVLQTDLTSALSSPEQLHLLLVGLQRFPGVLRPKKLKKLLGSTHIFTKENIPRLLELLKMAAKSVRKEKTIPAMGLDLLRVSLQEQAFELFWREVVENGLLQDETGPSSYMCYRLLGSSLPLLSLAQLRLVLRSPVLQHYGDHVVSAQLPDRFKFAPEMEAYVGAFLEGCADPDRQLAVLTGFSMLTNRGYPVVPSFWRVVRHLRPETLRRYVAWLQDMFLSPDLDSCLDFTTDRQKKNQENEPSMQNSVFRLRKWLIPRLVSLVEYPQLMEEADVMGIARFCFFHAFFETTKPTADIPETQRQPSVPLDDETREVTASSFFSLLQNLNSLLVMGSSAEALCLREKHVQGVTLDGRLWIHCLVQFADLLLSHGKNVKAVRPFTEDQKAAWDRMLKSVGELQKKGDEAWKAESSAFQLLLLLVGIHLFKNPLECVNLLGDLHGCIENAMDKKFKKTRAGTKRAAAEPGWVEVMVEILLSLLAQPSRLMRQAIRSVFARICPHLSRPALQLILDVLDPSQDGEEGPVVVTEERSKKAAVAKRDRDEAGSQSSADDNSDADTESEDEVRDAEVDENFRKQLMNVLHAGKTLDGDSSDEELSDQAMMALDENLSSLFAEQKLRAQAKKNEKDKIRKEKNLRREFKMKVLDLVEMVLAKQADNPLVLELIEPLLTVIERSMNSDAGKQEQEFLRKTASIFTNQLCRAKQYCHSLGGRHEELHALLQRLVERACRQSDSSVALCCFNASLYLLRVLKGNVSAPAPIPTRAKTKKAKKDAQVEEALSTSCLDLPKVTELYGMALTGFLSKRNSPLTMPMFADLFGRHPLVCKQLLPMVTSSITDGARQHQQGQACVLLRKALQSHELRLSLTNAEWEELLREGISQVTQSLKKDSELKVKADQQKEINRLELISFLIKAVKREASTISLEETLVALRALQESGSLGNSIRLHDLFWQAMKLLGVQRPKKEKFPAPAKDPPAAAGSAKQRKKGFLPETKKRKNRKKAAQGAEAQGAGTLGAPGAEAKGPGCDEAAGEEPPAPSEKKKKKKRRQKKKKPLQNGVAPSPDGPPASTQPQAQRGKRQKEQAQAEGGTAEPGPPGKVTRASVSPGPPAKKKRRRPAEQQQGAGQ
ncbi:myb-binding protein 1A [Tachyglossus aculeatus]|uniref:myb-binding protein 1A n=1 Tax=Tachyglossus aculeatus TaxID=9261 RepID=UPI0018F51881|nr:myb-binding protein 1A [Tachyglossus aculeatus]